MMGLARMIWRHEAAKLGKSYDDDGPVCRRLAHFRRENGEASYPISANHYRTIDQMTAAIGIAQSTWVKGVNVTVIL